MSFIAAREEIYGQPERHCVSVTLNGKVFYMQDIPANSVDGELEIIREAMKDRAARDKKR